MEGDASMRATRRALQAGLLLLTLCLLTGCAAEPEEREMLDLTQIGFEARETAPWQDAWADTVQPTVLCFLDEDMDRLVPVTRELVVTGGVHPAQSAFFALLDGPQASEDGAFWQDPGEGKSGVWLEISGAVATANLPARFRALTPEQLYAIRLAIAGTLTQFSDISYVNVLIGGQEEGLDLASSLPVGALSRVQDMDAASQYRRSLEQAQDASGLTLQTTLFYPTTDGHHVLASVRNVAYPSASPIDCLYALLTELGRGTNQALVAQDVPAPMDYILDMPEIVRTSEGSNRAIEIRFSTTLDQALTKAGLTRGIYLAMLTDTLMNFVPGVEGLIVWIGEENISQLTAAQTPDGAPKRFEQGLITRGDFLPYTGSTVTLYAADQETDKLQRVECVLEQSLQCNPRAQLDGLIKLCHERQLLQDSVGTQDILAVSVENGHAQVNLSGAFADALSGMSPGRTRAMIYAMVNTLTEDQQSRSVSFFFDGLQRERLSGDLEMRGSFLRNPGMVVNDGGSSGLL